VVLFDRSLMKGKATIFATVVDNPLSCERPFKCRRRLFLALEIDRVMLCRTKIFIAPYLNWQENGNEHRNVHGNGNGHGNGKGN
jgi:hypothetical protein